MNKKYILAAGLVFLFSTVIVHAASKPITLTTLTIMIRQIGAFLVITSALIVTIAILWSGIKWAMAGDDTAKVKEAKDSLKAAILGAFVIFGVGVIIATVTQVLTGTLL